LLLYINTESEGDTMTKKSEGGNKAKSSRASRFSLRNFLATTNMLTGANNANLPLPSTATRAKDPFPFNKKRNCKLSVVFYHVKNNVF